MAGPKRRLTDAGFWDMFLGNLQPVAGVHNLAFTYYVQHQLEFDQLDSGGRMDHHTGSKAEPTGHRPGAGQAIYSRP